MKHLLRLALIGSALPLAGCMTTGTNMHGDFACRAPNGTCAPMSSIDAKAVSGLGAGTQPVGGIADPTVPREGRVVTASADGSPPGRTSDRVLRVVFPAHIDASGIYHDESTAHAVVEHGGWTDGLTGGTRRTMSVETAVAVQPGKADALQTGKLATLDEVIAARAAQTRKSDDVAAAPGAAFTPTSAPAAMPAAAPGVALVRSPGAIDLREAAAAASAQLVAGLDPNFDTPDVTAAVVDEPGAPPGHCTGYRPVWWHGHAYRRLRPVPCPTRVAVAPGALPAPIAPSAPPSTRALNLGRLDTAAPTGSAEVETPKPASASAAITSPSAPALPILPEAEQVPASTGEAVAATPTSDPSVAAARVSMLAKPIVADQLRLGRADATAAAPAPLGQLLAGTGVTAAAVSGENPR